MNELPQKCAWCGRWLNRPADFTPQIGQKISHGICPTCVAAESSQIMDTRAVVERVKNMSREELAASLVNAGIHTKDGKLTTEYERNER